VDIWEVDNEFRKVHFGYIQEVFCIVLVHSSTHTKLIAGLENHPSIPKFNGDETATFPIVHNWGIRTPADLPPDNILIVGAGPSAMDIAEEASITKGAKNVTLASRKPHLGLPDRWVALMPWSIGATWLWSHNITEIRVLYHLYRFLPVACVDSLVWIWSWLWTRRYGIPEWAPVGNISLYRLIVDLYFSQNVAFYFRTKLIAQIRKKYLYVPAISINSRTLQVAGVHSIDGDTITLTNNVVLRPQILVCATGWKLDLACLPPNRANQSFETVQSRLFSRFYDIDYPGLFFVSLSNGFMCATENANLVSQAIAQILLGNWKQPSMATMVSHCLIC
jgi:hypothetical protein